MRLTACSLDDNVAVCVQLGYATEKSAKKDLNDLLSEIIKRHASARKLQAKALLERAQDAEEYDYDEDADWVEYWAERTE
ncbi:hypothetical protein HDU88_003211 [Geranomyces variabilis]|nr:hypothetical protein HDU88_003211 [Geranomyces variabilis]